MSAEYHCWLIGICKNTSAVSIASIKVNNNNQICSPVLLVFEKSILTEQTHSGTTPLCSVVPQSFHHTKPVLWERPTSCWTQHEDNRAGHQLVQAFAPTWQNHCAGKFAGTQAKMEARPRAVNKSKSKNILLHRWRLDWCSKKAAAFRIPDQLPVPHDNDKTTRICTLRCTS